MTRVTLQQAIRTRASANRRRATLDRRFRSHWGDEVAPLHACGDAFAGDIREIEAAYDRMINRINNATIEL